MVILIERKIINHNEATTDISNTCTEEINKDRQTDRQIERQTDINTCSVMQFNTLAQRVCYKDDNFILCDENDLNIDTRIDKICAEILRYSPDIVCLEEVDYYTRLLSTLTQHGYTGEYFQKYSQKYSGKDDAVDDDRDGTAIFWKKKEFKLKSIDKYYYRDNNIDPLLYNINNNNNINNNINENKTIDMIGCQTQGFIILSIISLYNDSTLVVAATHLKSKQKFEHVRVSQVKQLIRCLQKNVQPGTPIFLCGDLNAEPEDECVRWLCEQRDVILESTHTHTHTHLEYTTWKVRPTGEVKRIIGITHTHTHTHTHTQPRHTHTYY
eukprot:GHVR01152304.1.p1 GENE.GHVR01152304.1~~GHVR01152304.1.p1  ORF type:complete len:326 (+),score=115.99 GHVR01152304.1:120-1097(+)